MTVVIICIHMVCVKIDRQRASYYVLANRTIFNSTYSCRARLFPCWTNGFVLGTGREITFDSRFAFRGSVNFERQFYCFV